MTIFFLNNTPFFLLYFPRKMVFLSVNGQKKLVFLKAKYACASDIKTLHLCKFTFSNSLSLRVIKCSVTKNSNITLLIRNMYVM